MTAAATKPLPDGRHERTRRTREALIRAYMEIVEESGREPLAGEIAERVGCSLRTVFERFGSLNGLALAVFDSILDQNVVVPLDHLSGKSRAERIAGYIAVRSEVCERWYPLWRVLMRSSHDCPELDDRLDTVRKRARQRIEKTFSEELAALRDTTRSALLIALESVLDFGVWGRMRHRQGLSIDQARAVWVEGMDTLLPRAAAT